MDYNASLQAFVQDLKRRKVLRSSEAAVKTVELLRYLASTKANNVEKLLEAINDLGTKLTTAQPTQLVLGNMVARVAHIVREEKERAEAERALGATGRRLDTRSSLLQLMSDQPVSPMSEKQLQIKQPVIEGIQELLQDITSSNENIAEQAIEHLHANEIIMTFGKSSAVEGFFKAAAKYRKFEVIVAESAPSFQGQEMAKSLSKAGIQTTLIPDSAIYTMMARVNKVIVGATAIFANGGILALSGSHMVALAAKAHSVPVIVCSSLYKLSPLFPHDQDTFNDLLSPNEVLEFEEAGEVQNCRVLNPRFDYVPPSLLSLLVTNDGGHSPSYVYRLLAEFYSQEDVHDILTGPGA